MKKKHFMPTAFTLLVALMIACAGCGKKPAGGEAPKELTVSTDGTLEVETKVLAMPDAAKEKSVFLAVYLKEDADIGLQYTYDTRGKEGAMLCCDVNLQETGKVKGEPVCAMRLAQSSEENYGEIWQSGGTFLKKGKNVFYLSGGDQTLPCRIRLKLIFFAPEKIERAVLYPEKNES